MSGGAQFREIVAWQENGKGATKFSLCLAYESMTEEGMVNRYCVTIHGEAGRNKDRERNQSMQNSEITTHHRHMSSLTVDIQHSQLSIMFFISFRISIQKGPNAIKGCVLFRSQSAHHSQSCLILEA